MNPLARRGCLKHGNPGGDLSKARVPLTTLAKSQQPSPFASLTNAKFWPSLLVPVRVCEPPNLRTDIRSPDDDIALYRVPADEAARVLTKQMSRP
jgi:hypothetical protein